MLQEGKQQQPHFSPSLITFSVSPDVLALEEALEYPHTLSASDSEAELDRFDMPELAKTVSSHYEGTPIVRRTFDVTASLLDDVPSHTAAASLMADLGGRFLDDDPLGLAHTFTLQVPVEAKKRKDALQQIRRLAAELALLEGIHEVSLVPLRYTMQHHPTDPLYGYQWHHKTIGSEYAWTHSMGDRSIAIAVVDTGVDLDHEDLSDNIDVARCLNATNEPAPGSIPAGLKLDDDFVGTDKAPYDQVGHGTHVAGIICAREGNGKGVVGVAPRCTLVPVKSLLRYRLGHSATATRPRGSAESVAEGIRKAAYTEGVKVINLSVGGWAPTRVEFRALLAARARGCVVICAAGNAGAFKLVYPAAYKVNRPKETDHMLVVGATTARDFIAPFSNFGDTIDVVAPGDRIFSTWLGDTYEFAEGTSMSAPIVAGIAALLFSIRPNAPVSRVVRTITESVHEPTRTGKNHYFGWGRVSADRAVNRFARQSV